MAITVTATALPEVKIIEPKVFGDARGFFYESFNGREFAEHVEAGVEFVQDNHSRSAKGVLRGLHYQIEHAQGKLVRVVEGEVFDVAVDVRRSSPNFGKWVGVTLSTENHRQPEPHESVDQVGEAMRGRFKGPAAGADGIPENAPAYGGKRPVLRTGERAERPSTRCKRCGGGFS